MAWIEHATSPLPRECSTTELHGQNLARAFKSSCNPSISNPGLHPILERVKGIEPSKAEPSDLQSDPFDRSGTPPNETRDFGAFYDDCQTIRGVGSGAV